MSIFVKDMGLKVQFSKDAVKGYVEYAGDAEAFAARLASIGEESPKHAYMSKVWEQNGKLRIKSSNKFAAELRKLAKVQAPKQDELSIEDIMAEAEQENARRDAKQESVKQMSEKRRKAIEAELAKYGMSIAS